MKKRAKIITTIASLCLAVALMAFGVYAATTVTFGVTSKVSFTATDVYVGITGNIYANTTAAPGTTPLATYAEAKSFTGTVGNNAVPENSGSTYAIPTWTENSLEITSTNKVIVYVITIQNYGTKSVTVTATNTNDYEDTNMSETAWKTGTGASASAATTAATDNVGASETIAAGAFRTYLYAASLVDAANDVDECPIALSFSIVQTPVNP